MTMTIDLGVPGDVGEVVVDGVTSSGMDVEELEWVRVNEHAAVRAAMGAHDRFEFDREAYWWGEAERFRRMRWPDGVEYEKLYVV